jgi:nitrate/nitrite-specific signal transduction histidine kinase
MLEESGFADDDKRPENRMPAQDLLVFHQLTRSLTSSFDLDAILRTILEHMERIIEAELWTLLMLDEATRSSTTPSPPAASRRRSRTAREGGRGRGRLGGPARRDADRSRTEHDPRI